MRGIALSLLLGAALAVAGAANAAEGTKAPYPVSMIVAKTGVLATVLGPAGTGFEAYIDRVNKAGGVDGHPIQLDQLDEQSAPNVANGLIQRVLTSPPLALVFFGQSTSQTQSRRLLEGAGLPVLSVTVDDSFLYPKPTKTMFQLNPSAAQQAAALVALAEQKVGDLKGKKVAVALVQTTFSDGILKVIERIGQQRGFTVADAERFPAGIPSFSSQGAKIARSSPDAVFVFCGNADAPLVIKAIGDAGVTSAPIVGYAAISSNDIFSKLELPNYFSFRSAEVAADLPELRAKVQDPRLAADMTNTWWGSGWMVADVLVQGLKKCGEGCTGAKLIDVLETAGPFANDDHILFGPVTFSPTEHAGVGKVQGYKWDGKAVVKSGEPVAMVRPAD